jgi:hypothetical protein
MTDPALSEIFCQSGVDRVLCQPCLRIVLFGIELTASPGLASPLKAFIKHFGGQIAWYIDGFHQSTPKRLTKEKSIDVFEKMQMEIMRPKGAVATLMGPSKKGEWRTPAFRYWKSGGISAPFVMMSLPIEWLNDKGENGVKMFLREIMSGDFPLLSGYVGLSILWNDSFLSDETLLSNSFRKWLVQYPGLMHPTPLAQIDFARNGLVDIGWITLLGSALAAKINGGEQLLTKISADLRSEIEIDRFSNGELAIQAGAMPVLGDRASNDFPLLQKEVGAALALLRDSRKSTSLFVPGFSTNEIDESRSQWVNRFFF